MRIIAQFFAHLADIAGECERAVLLPQGTTGSQYAEILIREDARFGDGLRHSRIAINDDWASFDDVLGDGDRVAFVPPVSGG